MQKKISKVSMMKKTITLAFASLFLSSASIAHDGVVHENLNDALKHQEKTSPNTLGFPEVKGGDFDLIDHNGQKRTSKNPDGHYQMVFFGYANCKAMCSVALPRMSAAIDLLKKEDVEVTPILITVDPERDTVENMKEALTYHHEDMIGLTGSTEALDVAYKAFNIEKSLVYDHPEHGPIYAHGSFIYLIGPNGEFKTLMPPILSSERMAEVARGYIFDERS